MFWTIISEILMFLMSLLAIIFILINLFFATRAVTHVYKYIHCEGVLENLVDETTEVLFYGDKLTKTEFKFIALYFAVTVAFWIYLGLCLFTYNWFLAILPILLVFYPKKRQGASFIVLNHLINALSLIAMLVNYTYFHHILK